MKARTTLIAWFATALSLTLSSLQANAQCDVWRDGPLGNGLANGADGNVFASTLWDPDGAGPLPTMLVVGGDFTHIEGVPARHIAMHNPVTGDWSQVGGGVATTPYAIAVHNGELIVGGSGSPTPFRLSENLLRFDGSRWQLLGIGTITGDVYALASYDGDLYAGGDFAIDAPPLAAFNLARWDPSTQQWRFIDDAHSTPSGPVRDLTVWNDELIIAGDFQHFGGQHYEHIVHFNGTNFGPWGLGHNYPISALGSYNGSLAIASTFDTPTGTARTVALWNGTAWTPLGADAPNDLAGNIRSITSFNGSLYAGGLFPTAGGFTSGANIARYNGTNWQALTTGTDGEVRTLVPFSGNLFVGGSFGQAGGVPANRMVRWNGALWLPYGGGVSNGVYALTTYVDLIVGGGSFTQSLKGDDIAVNIGGYDGASLRAFGSGMDNTVFALKSFTYPGISGKNELIAGGSFAHAGGIAASCIARWDQDPVSSVPPPAWAAMGPGFNSTVTAIERFNNVTYAGGLFTSSGGTGVSHIARWNETTKLWEAVGTGMNGSVLALCTYNGSLYAGGAFTTAGGVATGGLARWNGTSWSAVGGVFSGTVFALTVHNGLLVIGGSFPGINNSPNLAWYNGSSYGTFGSNQGTDSAVRALHSTGSRLYIAGGFTTLGALSVNRAAYYENGSWFALRGGTNDITYAISHYHNLVHYGGLFAQVNNATPFPVRNWARYDETGGPQIRSNPSSLVANYGQTISFTCVPDTGYYGLTLQWYRNGTPLQDGPTGQGSVISGSDGEVLKITNFGAGDVGSYWMTVTNSCTSATSSTATATGNVGVEGSGLPFATTFDAIAPNPARQGTRLAFSLAHEARVRVRVQDVAGRTIRGIDAGAMAAGQHAIAWDMRGEDGSSVRPGMYFVGLEVDGKRLGTRTLAIIR